MNEVEDGEDGGDESRQRQLRSPNEEEGHVPEFL